MLIFIVDNMVIQIKHLFLQYYSVPSVQVPAMQNSYISFSYQGFKLYRPVLLLNDFINHGIY